MDLWVPEVRGAGSLIAGGRERARYSIVPPDIDHGLSYELTLWHLFAALPGFQQNAS